MRANGSSGDGIREVADGVMMITRAVTNSYVVAFHLPDRDVVFTGDALVTFDPYTGGSGPQIVARAATADSDAALAALPALTATAAAIVLPGHGDAWVHGIRDAVGGALARGAH